jgi:hypothetical protein
VNVQKSHIHGKGLFAEESMREVNLGPYSNNFQYGAQAERTIMNIRTGKLHIDVVHCTEIPTAFAYLENESGVFEPFLLLPPAIPQGTEAQMSTHTPGPPLHRVNQAPTFKTENTRITTRGDFIVTKAEKGEELLTNYGKEYWNKRRKKEAPTDNCNALKGNAKAQTVARRTETNTAVQETKKARMSHGKSAQPREEKGAAGQMTMNQIKAKQVSNKSTEDTRTPITETTANLEAGMRISKVTETTTVVSTLEGGIAPHASFMEACAPAQMQAWILSCHRRHAATHTHIAQGVRVALYKALKTRGIVQTSLVTSQGSDRKKTEEEADAEVAMSEAQLGWKRRTKQETPQSTAWGQLRKAVRHDADLSQRKTARTYTRNHAAKFERMGILYPELKKETETIIKEEVLHNVGKPRSVKGRIIIHLCAGTGPLIPLRGRYGFESVDIEKDDKQWQVDTNQKPYEILPPEGKNLIREICQKNEKETSNVMAILVSSSCDTTTNASNIKHWGGQGQPLTDEARKQQPTLRRMIQETITFIQEEAIQGRWIMYAFEQGQSSSYHKHFLPHAGMTIKELQNHQEPMRFPIPKQVEWGDYAAPIKRKHYGQPTTLD